jgi:hypothetical protein
MGKLKSVLTAKKKGELLSSFKSSTVSIINLISASAKSPEEKILLIESILVLSEIIDLEQERVRYELLMLQNT